MRTLLLLFLCILPSMAYSIFQSDKSIDKLHLNLVHSIKDVIITTQKTRGLTNNYMNGNVVAQLLVYGQRKNMKDNFKAINQNFSKLELPVEHQQLASQLIISSKMLNKRAFKGDSAQVFSTYSSYIEKWMDLNELIINYRFKQADQNAYNRLVLLNNVLLPLTENIGKMRGLGSGIVARGYCKEEEVPKMQSFVSEIKRYKLALHRHLAATSYVNLSSKEAKKIEESIQVYAALTENKVIGKKGITLVTNEYFDQGTRTISNVLKVYNVVAAQILK